MGLEVVVERFGPGGEHDGLAALGIGKVELVSQSMPEFLGDERKERMEQAQHVGQHEIDDREGVGLARRVVPWNTALEASMYQSQYSFQKKRWRVWVTSVNR
jgi:hypothetical protein